MKENKQIIYHKSDWGSQLIKIVLILSFLFFSYKKNPTKELFIQELIRGYASKQGIDSSSSILVSELSSSLFGGIIDPLIKRNDFVIFSTYEIELNNQYVKGKVKAFGFWDNILFYNENRGDTLEYDVEPTINSITSESQLRKKYPCVNQEPGGVSFSPILNNKTVITFSDGSSYELTIDGDKVFYTIDGTPLCK
jgi:hypothetical protein